MRAIVQSDRVIVVAASKRWLEVAITPDERDWLLADDSMFLARLVQFLKDRGEI